MEKTVDRYFRVTAAEAGTLSDALQIVDLSVVWHGTRDRSWERFTDFIRRDGKNELDQAVGLIHDKLRRSAARTAPPSRCLAFVRSVFFQNTGVCLGGVWLSAKLLTRILAACEEFLCLADRGSAASHEELGSLRVKAFEAHLELCSVLPAGKPRSQLCFFGCEDYGKTKALSEVLRSA